ncbi:MAG: CBS domain-containing protein [Thaumarchaeota archaeon]|nr:CBS domain-containing protein [Candidatus Calditenuaceae archaeon]MDW8041791.1 CBS domain-containing protein [Nitrososphaerota archaeon]
MSKDMEAVQAEEPLIKVASVFAEKDVDVVLVLSGEQLVGLLTERVLLRPKVNLQQVKAKTFAIPVPRLKADDSVARAAKLMVENNIRALPVVEENSRPIGVVGVFNLLEACRPFLRGLKVKQVMTEDPVTVAADDSIGKVVAVMRDEGVSRLPVVQNDRLVGIITLHDLIVKVLGPRYRSTVGEVLGEKIPTLGTRAKDIMNSPVITCSPDDDLLVAVEKMRHYDVSCVVVIEGQRVVGIVTRTDALEPLASIGEEEVGVHVQVSFKLANSPSEQEKSSVLESVSSFVRRYGDTIGSGTVTLHFKEHREKHGEIHLIHCRARLNTDRYRLVGVGEGWTPTLAARAALHRIERQLTVSKELEQRYDVLSELAERY